MLVCFTVLTSLRLTITLASTWCSHVDPRCHFTMRVDCADINLIYLNHMDGTDRVLGENSYSVVRIVRY